MPHPISPAASTPGQDDELPDAPALSENGSLQSEEDHKSAPTEEDQMDIEPPQRPKGVCLDKIFDDDEDDELLASGALEVKPEAATMYV